MSAAALIARATAAGVRLWVEGGQVRVRAARPPAPELLAALRAKKDEVRRILTSAVPPPPPPPSRDAWGLTEAEKAEGAARIASTPQLAAAPDLATADHDAGERIAMAAHYAEPSAKGPPPAVRPDPLREGLYRGFHAHRPASRAPPVTVGVAAPATAPRQQPAGCSICGSRRRWCRAGEDLTKLRCWTCHPPDHLQSDQIHEVTT